MKNQDVMEKKVGLSICHCGDNIKGAIDIERLKYALKDEDLIFMDENPYLCSVDGQKMMQDRIKSSDLDGIVVAACSPEIHQEEFRDCAEAAGINRYMVDVANIREQCAWIDKDPDPTLRAIDMVRSSIMAMKNAKPRKNMDLHIVKSALVMGGGISGITAALSLARQNIKVYLVEKSPTIGGNMFKIGKVFSADTLTEECAMCSLGPIMGEVADHPNVEVLNLSEVEEVTGHAGDFKVKIRSGPYMVDPEICTSCGECSRSCRVEVPDEWNANLSTRKAVYRPFPQAVPGSYTVDVDSCIRCGSCVDACSAGAIKLDSEASTVTLNVGSLVIATGYQELDPRDKEEFKYGVEEDVITQMELARMLAVNGPTSGQLITSKGEKPRRMVMVQCVGSRDRKTGSIPHCSTIGCMVALKHANYIANHFKGTEVYICYTDMRTPGTYENYYFETQKKGEKSIRFLRGKVAEVLRDRDENLITRVEDTLGGGFLEVETDMVVLSCALKPSDGAESLEETLGVSLTPELFVKEKHPKLNPTETTVPGIFVCGTAKGAMDITEAINMSRSAASQVSELLAQGTVQIEPRFAVINQDACDNCGECLEHCPNSAIHMEDYADVDPLTCRGCGNCTSKCPIDAIELPGSSDSEILARIDGCLEDENSKILAFLVEKIAYVAADNIGLNRVSYPSDVRIIRVPSVARLELKHILHAFKGGAAGIFLGDGTVNASGSGAENMIKEKYEELKDGLILEGIDPNRLTFYEAYLPHYKGMASRLEEFSERVKAFSYPISSK